MSFQRLKTCKQSNDPNFETKKNRILELYYIADGKSQPGPGDPSVVICVDEFGPLNLQPHPGRQSAPAGGDGGRPRRCRRTTYKRPTASPLLAAYDLSTDRLYGHIKTKRTAPPSRPLRFVRSLHPDPVRIAVVLDNFSPHVSHDIRAWADEHNVELAFVPFYAGWLKPHRGQFTPCATSPSTAPTSPQMRSRVG